MKIALVCIEGPLSQGADLRSSAPQKWAIPLYTAIRSQFRTFGLTQGVNETTREWLRKEGFAGWSGLLSWNTIMSYEDWVFDTVRDFLANGWEIAFLLTADPSISQRATDLGVLTLTVGMPLHLPGWKADDEGFTPWNKLEARTA